MAIEHAKESQSPAELPFRLYSALRTIRIYPPRNPQVKKSTEHLFSLLVNHLQDKDTTITIASSEQKVLVNGEPLPIKDQHRPQLQSLVELFYSLRIHALTFHGGFSMDDCVRLLKILADATGGTPLEKPLKTLLQEAGLKTVSVDEKRYVAVHEGEQVVPESYIGYGGGSILTEDGLIEILFDKIAEYGGPGGISPATIEQLSSLPERGRGEAPAYSEGGKVLDNLVAGLDEMTSEKKKSSLIDNSSAALADLTPTLLSKLLGGLPKKHVADELLDKIVERLDLNQLEALLLNLTDVLATEGKLQTDKARRAKNLTTRLRGTNRAQEIEEINARIKNARQLIGLNRAPTPPHLQVQLQQAEWAVPVLVSAMRQLTGLQQENPKSTDFVNLLSRYDNDLASRNQEKVASEAGVLLAKLQDQELSRILIQPFRGSFGEEVYNAVIEQLPDAKFEQIAQILNRLVQKKSSSILKGYNLGEIQTAYDRFMQSERGQQFRTVLENQQESENRERQLDKEQLLENIKLLLGGNHEILANSSFVDALPTGVRKMLHHEKKEAVDQLLTRIVTGLYENDTNIQRGSAEALGSTAYLLMQHGEWQRLEKLLPALREALPLMEKEQTISATMDTFEQFIRVHLGENGYGRAINALDPIFELIVSPPEGSPQLREHALSCLSRLAKPDLISPLLDEIQAGTNNIDNCWYLISHLGEGAANFLIEKLAVSETWEEREQLLNLIEDIGKPAQDALLLLLQQDVPWYLVRNIIRSLRKVGDATCFSAIAPYINHDDLRVQLEVVHTLGTIGGTARKGFFLKNLPGSPEELKPEIVRQLGKIRDEGIVLPLTDLLESSAGPPYQKKENLQAQICTALARIGSKKAIPALSRIIQTKNIPGIEDYSPIVLAAAEQALSSINTHPGSFNGNGGEAGTVGYARMTRKNDPLAIKEASIFRKANRGMVEEAKQDLCDLILFCVEQKDFANAERLRERLYEIDPMALSEIIRTGEIIERGKTGAVSRDQLSTWSKLLDKLGSVEFSAIYHELEERTFPSEDVIVWQGDKNEELFFVNQGSIKVSYTKNNHEIFVTSLNAGQIIGENFFDASHWTVTLTALTAVRLSALNRDSFQRWQEAYPGLEIKLKSFYQECDVIRQLLEKKRLDRRENERFKLSRKIQVQLIDQNSNPIGRGFRGELTDISLGGLAFLIRISKRENTRLLLGRTMRITIPLAGDSEHLQLSGLAMGIQPYQPLENDFSVHIRLSELLDEQTLQQILG